MVIRIGTWNLENLFKPPNPFAPKTEEEYQAKLDALASAITRMDPHVLAVQEVGDPVALGELADRVGGTWHIETAAPETGTAHTIRVGVLSRLPLTTFDPVAAFPDKLRAIQQGDKPTENTTAMGRPALHVRVHIQDTDIDLITAHFKSKLLTFPDGRFNPLDEGERARFGAYALYRRAAEAVTVRAAATDLLTSDDERIGDGARRSQRRGRGRHHPDPQRPDRLRDRHRRLQPARPRRPAAAVESGPTHPRSPTLQPQISGTQGTDRPHLRQPRPGRKDRSRPRHHRRRRTDALHR